MEAFWNWLMRANARAVLLAALVALLAVLAFWVWTEFSTLAEERAVASIRPATETWPPLGLRARIEQEAAREVRVPERSPFIDYRGRAERAAAERAAAERVATERAAAEAAQAEQARPAAAGPDERPRPPRPDPRPDTPPVETSDAGYTDPPPPLPETTVLEFRGLLQSSEGERMGLIRADGAPRFFRIGETLKGFRLSAVDAVEARIDAPDGTGIPLPIGVPTTLEISVPPEED